MLNRGLVAVVVTLTITATVMACGGGSSGTAQTKVVIGYEQCGACDLNVTIGQKYFQKYMPNAQIELRVFDSGPAALAALASGALNFMTEVGSPPVARAITGGLPLSVVWVENANVRSEGLAVRDGSPVKSLQDLKGQSVATVLGSSSNAELYYALKGAGVPYNSVKLLNLGPPEIQAAWDTHRIDMFYCWQPVFGYALNHGGHVLMYNEAISDVMASLNLDVVNTSWAKQHPDLVKGFAAAMNAGVVYAAAHPDEALTMMAKIGGIDANEAKIELAGYDHFDLSQQLTSKALGIGNGVVTSAAVLALEGAAGFLVATGNLTSAAPSANDFAAHVDPSFVQQVIASSS